MADDERDPLLMRLERFVGVWNTTRRMRPTDGQPAGEMTATDRYEWLPGKHFMLHTVDARMDEAPHRSIEIMGYDAGRRVCTTRSYDDEGGIGDYDCVLDGDRWTITGEQVRFDGAFGPNGRTLEGTWERRGPDGDWTPWLDIVLTRAD